MLLPPPLASALWLAVRPPLCSRRRSPLLPSNLRRHLLSLLTSHPCRYFSLLPSRFFPDLKSPCPLHPYPSRRRRSSLLPLHPRCRSPSVQRGFEVLVLERDMSAIRWEGRYRGPIQLQSNTLAALEAIFAAAADEVMDASCITGDHVNGIVDGASGSWYINFDMFTPAAERGLPVTRVISRMTLQQNLVRAVDGDAMLNDSHVVDFIDDGNKVTIILEDGRKFEGDVLVGVDGIWSKVRKALFGHTEVTYSGYTCYTGIADFVPPDIDTVGYQVFLGHKQYFVSSDVSVGKM